MREIPRKFELTAVQGHTRSSTLVIQGHRPWCQSKAHVRLPISH